MNNDKYESMINNEYRHDFSINNTAKEKTNQKNIMTIFQFFIVVYVKILKKFQGKVFLSFFHKRTSLQKFFHHEKASRLTENIIIL